MSINDPVFKEAKEKASKFYDKEHNLTREDRQELYIFFEQQFRRSLLLSSIGFASGVAIPFILKKKGQLVNPFYPIVGGFIGSGLLPSLFTQTIYNRQLSGVADKYGKESAVYKVIEVTPDPLTKAFFWSSYFKKSSENPQLRIKDPRTITDSTSGIVIDKPDPSNIPQYGKPENSQNLDPSQLSINQQQYQSSWDKIRKPPPASISNTSTNEQGLSGFSSNNTLSSGIDDDILETDTDTDTDTDSNKPKQTFGDNLISNSGPKGSSWDNIRRGNK